MATLTKVNTISGAKEDVPYNITFGILKTYADESSNTLSFKITSVDTTKGTLAIYDGSNNLITGSNASTYFTTNRVQVSQAGIAINGTIQSGYTLKWQTLTNQNGTLTGAFTVQASESQTTEANLSSSAAVTLSALPVNDAPTLTSFSTLSGAIQASPLEITYATLIAQANAADVEGDVLSFRIESVTSGTLKKWTASAWQDVSAGVTLIGLDEKLQWTPTTFGDNQAAFTIKAYDGLALSIDPAVTVTVNVAPANNPPVFSRTGSAAQTINDNQTTAPFSGISLTDDSASLSVTVTLDSSTKGVMELGSSGFTGSNGVYTYTDTPINAQTALKALVYNPTDNRVPVGQTETTTFTVSINDGKNTVTDSTTTVVANSVNVAPSLSTDDALSATEDKTYAFAQSVFTSRYTDNDGDSLSTIKVSSLPPADQGQLKLAGTPITATTEIPASQLATLSFIPASNYNGTASLQWQAYDGFAWSIPATLSLTVASVPDIQSVSVPDSKTYKQGETLSFIVTFDEAVNVTGTPRIPLNIGGSTYYANYTATNNQNLSFSYTLVSGLTDTDGIDTSGSIDLNGGTLVGKTDNNAPASYAFTAATSGILVDSQPPSLSLSASRTQFKAGETAAITFTFSEPVTVSPDAVTTTGGTLSNFAVNAINHKIYTATFTPTANTDNLSGSISVAATAYTDTAGNNGTAGNTLALTGDTQPPSLTISSDKTSFKAGETANVSFTFSETPTGFDATDITTTGGTLTALIGTGLTRTATFTPTANTNNLSGSISVAAGRFTDTIGNNGTASNTLTLTGDTQAPSLTLSSSKTSFKAGETATLTFTFSETPTGFDASDISATGGTLGAISGTGLIRTATFTPTVTDSLAGLSAGVSIANATYTDAAGNTGTKNTPLAFSYTGDTQVPTLTITSNKTNYKYSESATLTFTFSETPTGFTASDIVATNGSLSGFAVTGDNKIYTAQFTLGSTSLENITANISVAANTYTDTGGNNPASSSALALSYFRSGSGSLAAPSALATTGDDVLNGNVGTVTGNAITYNTGTDQGNDWFEINTDVQNYAANIVINGFGTGDKLVFITNGLTTSLATLDGIYAVRDNLSDITLVANQAGSVQRIKLAGLTSNRSAVGGSVDSMTELSTFLGANTLVEYASAGTLGVGTRANPATNETLGNDILNANQRSVTGLPKVFHADQGNDQYLINTDVRNFPANIHISGLGNGDQLVFDVSNVSLGISQLNAIYAVSDNGSNITLTANATGSVQSITLMGLSTTRPAAIGGSVDSITELATFLGAGAIDLI